MRISHAHKFVFLAYPRTASTSMRDLLDPFCEVRSVHIDEVTPDHPFYHHISAAELRTIFHARGWDWSMYRKFAVVRNPYDRVVSLYHHHDRHYRSAVPGWRGLADRWGKVLRRRSRFARYVAELDPARRLHRPLSSFLGDENGRWLVDEVLRFESLDVEVPRLLSTLGLSGAIMPRLNESRHRLSYRRYYNRRSRDCVARLYAEDIGRFGYAF